MLHRVFAAALATMLATAVGLATPAATKAIDNTNVIAVSENEVFMISLDGLTIEDIVVSELTGEAARVVGIEPGWFDCEGYCDAQHFAFPEGTRGFIVQYQSMDEADMYGWFTEDHWTHHPYTCGDLAAELCPQIYDAPNAFPLNTNMAYMPSVTGLEVGDRVYSSVFNAQAEVVSITEGIFDCSNCNYALPKTGRGASGFLAKGYYVEFDDVLFPIAHQDHLYFRGAPKRTSVAFTPGYDHWNSRATYSIVRCTSGGNALTSKRMPTGCRLVRKYSVPSYFGGGTDRAQRYTHTYTSADRQAGYLRFGVTIGGMTFYSPAHRVNE